MINLGEWLYKYSIKLILVASFCSCNDCQLKTRSGGKASFTHRCFYLFFPLNAFVCKLECDCHFFVTKLFSTTQTCMMSWRLQLWFPSTNWTTTLIDFSTAAQSMISFLSYLLLCLVLFHKSNNYFHRLFNSSPVDDIFFFSSPSSLSVSKFPSDYQQLYASNQTLVTYKVATTSTSSLWIYSSMAWSVNCMNQYLHKWTTQCE